MVDTAVDMAAGHGVRMRLAGSLAQVTAKRRAVRRLRQHALNRRTLRAQHLGWSSEPGSIEKHGLKLLQKAFKRPLNMA